ncbi:MAG: hypothetical protein MZU91_05550 [Desulfosudis oleivorans]|nr:hypothetical protein [Desulfosudis oleivorans]
MSKISENIKGILGEIDATKVKVIAVSKYVGVKEIIQAYEAGIRNFGENRLQDAESKK